MFKVRVIDHLDSGHQLSLPYDSKCNNRHGHRWKVIVDLEAQGLNELGMVVDFTHVKEALRRYDHCFFEQTTDSDFRNPLGQHWVGDGVVLVWFIPTAENLARFFAHQIQWALQNTFKEFYPNKPEVMRIELWETPSGSTIFVPDPAFRNSQHV